MVVKRGRILKEFFSFNLFLIIIFCIFASGILAGTLECVINASGNCGGTKVFYLQNETGGYYNAHVQNNSIGTYNYALCCTSDDTLSNDCSDSPIIRLQNLTNSHIQSGTYSGSIYSNNACLSAQTDEVSCVYEINTTGAGCVSSGYSCVASMASSEPSDSNLTNSHIGPCSEYNMKICCFLNSVPSVANVILNSSFGTNYTFENLTVYFSSSDPQGDSVTNITDWRREGKSLALLNLAFNTNISSVSSGLIRDYSTFGNNGTLGGGNLTNSPYWNNSGKIGGGYIFDGLNDYINVINSSSLGSVNTFVSLTAWVNYADNGTYRNVVVKFWNDSNSGSAFGIRRPGDTNRTLFDINISGTRYTLAESVSAIPGNWNFYVGTYNGSLISLYKNGILQTTQAASGNIVPHTLGNLSVGGSGGYSSFNGTLDDIQVYNHSLSANQIQLMYLSGLENNSLRTIHFDETLKYQNWSVMVTSNDRNGDGRGVLSGNLTIRNSLPVVTLISPPNYNVTINRTLEFTWNSTDEDGDAMGYQINITAYKFQGASVCSDNYIQNTSQTRFMPSSPLLCFYDNGYYYNWSVRSNDSDGYGSWTSRILNLTAVVTISLPINNISFGTLSLLNSNDTSDNSPLPFIVQNDGNSLINITISATNLWSTSSNPSSYYRYKIDNRSGEEGSFHWGSSLTSFTNVPSSDLQSISQFNYLDNLDSAETDIYVQVPPNEPPTNRTSTMTFTSSLAE